MRQRRNILDLGLATCVLPYCCTCVDHLVFWYPSYTKQADPLLFLQDLKILTFCAPHYPRKLFLVQMLYLPGFAQKLPPQICDDDDVGTRSILNERSSHVLVYCSFCLTKKGPTTNPLSQHMRHIFTNGDFF